LGLTAGEHWKLNQARRTLAKMRQATKEDDFYDLLSLFLVATRSILMVFHQRAYRECRDKPALSPVERTKREAFDAWIDRAVKPHTRHLVKTARDIDVHRGGYPPIRWQPQGGGMAITDAGPAQPGVMAFRTGWSKDCDLDARVQPRAEGLLLRRPTRGVRLELTRFRGHPQNLG
jgi:hypothetical protein